MKYIFAIFAWFLLLTPALGRSLTDSRGKILQFTKKPERIASGCLASDEILLQLLGDVKGLDRLVALSYLADDPQYSNIAVQRGPDIKKVPGRVGNNLESLFALRPDLVILASYNSPDLLRKIEGAGIPTFVLGHFERLEDIREHILTLGELVFEEVAARKMAESFQASLGKKARLLHWNPDGTVLGAGTIFDDLVQQAGAVNVASEKGLKGWPRLSAEVLASWQVDFLVMAGEESERGKFLQLLRRTPQLAHTEAVKKERLILVPARELHAVSPYVLQALAKIKAAL